MRSIKSKNTQPELILRKLLTTLGYRYRLHKKELPGKPDIVFIGRKKVIFVHGCFWHGHNNCKIARILEIDYWKGKIARNRERDLNVAKDLSLLGWEALAIWECELADIHTIQQRLITFLDTKNSHVLHAPQLRISDAFIYYWSRIYTPTTAGIYWE